MNLVNSSLIKDAWRWIHLADEDLRLANHAFSLSTGVPYRLIAFHAQQCAEKYLKAYLVFHNVDFPYTHNIKRLLEFIELETDWKPDLTEAKQLTPFAVTLRYPGLDDDVTLTEAKESVKLAELVRLTIRQRMSSEGLVLPE